MRWGLLCILGWLFGVQSGPERCGAAVVVACFAYFARMGPGYFADEYSVGACFAYLGGCLVCRVGLNVVGLLLLWPTLPTWVAVRCAEWARTLWGGWCWGLHPEPDAGPVGFPRRPRAALAVRCVKCLLQCGCQWRVSAVQQGASIGVGHHERLGELVANIGERSHPR